MTDAPETIWARPDPYEPDWTGDRTLRSKSHVEYRRADLPPTPAQIMSDPNAVHINMLHGRIANPSVEQIVHIYAGKVQAVSVEPVTVQQAAKVLLGDDFTSPLLEVLDAYNNDYDVGQDVLKALRAIAGGRDE